VDGSEVDGAAAIGRRHGEDLAIEIGGLEMVAGNLFEMYRALKSSCTSGSGEDACVAEPTMLSWRLFRPRSRRQAGGDGIDQRAVVAEAEVSATAYALGFVKGLPMPAARRMASTDLNRMLLAEIAVAPAAQECALGEVFKGVIFVGGNQSLAPTRSTGALRRCRIRRTFGRLYRVHV